ncbi:MAG: phage holin family protein [Acidobacteriota bacterium]
MGTPDSRSLADVVADLTGNVREIIRGEIHLAGAELAANLRPFPRGLVLLGSAALLAAAGLACVVLTGVFALGLILPLWAASLIMAVTVLLVACLLAWLAVHGFKRLHGFPRTLAALKDSTRWPQHSKP